MNLQEEIVRIKSMMLIEYSDKYKNYKERWNRVNNYGDLYVTDPLSVDVYLFPNNNGFLVDLYYNGKLVGQFHCFMDEDEGMMNDVHIDEEYQNKGLGKVLLLKSMDVSYLYLDGFQPDVRGLTKSQGRVYDSLVKNGAIDNHYNINYDVAQKLINHIIDKLNSK